MGHLYSETSILSINGALKRAVTRVNLTQEVTNYYHAHGTLAK